MESTLSIVYSLCSLVTSSVSPAESGKNTQQASRRLGDLFFLLSTRQLRCIQQFTDCPKFGSILSPTGEHANALLASPVVLASAVGSVQYAARAPMTVPSRTSGLSLVPRAPRARKQSRVPPYLVVGGM